MQLYSVTVLFMVLENYLSPETINKIKLIKYCYNTMYDTIHNLQ